MPNRLADATSPYLLQHRDNPVDWWPWSDEAFAQARERDVPVLLSVGYAACHWCHVMAHESFEDDTVARLMNDGFVSVKVDREERPDVDAVYMNATQALTGHGGWPMTVFLTPDGRPFYAGTYFPPRPRHGMPSFAQLLVAIREAWQQRRDEIEQAGGRIATALSRRSMPVGEQVPGPDVLEQAARGLHAERDTTHGGFGGAPKFPPSMLCEFLLRHAAGRRLRAGHAPDGEAAHADSGELALETAASTLRAMAHSGIYDQVAGGFARYAVDAAWVVPHFEKMLYDNAQLARVYLHWWRLTGEPTGARVAQETCDWMLAELGTPEGGLASSLDADTAGVEGATYVWTPQQLADELGEDAGWAAELLRVSPDGSFEHGTSTLQLAHDVWADEAGAARWRRLRERLQAVRARRPQPGRDDKVVAAWNGLAVAALAETGALLDRPDLLAAAERAAGLLLDVHLVAGDGGGDRLRRVSRDGVAGRPGGVLEDYADVAEGLIALHAVTGTARWLDAAGRLLDVVLAEFAAPDGTFFDTPEDGTDPALQALGRPADPADNAYPSGGSASAGALLSYAALTGSERHREAAEAVLGRLSELVAAAPRAFGWALAVCESMADGPREIAVLGRAGDPGRGDLHRVALAGTAPGAVVSVGAPDGAGVPLLAGKVLLDEQPTAYVCRNFTCDRPTTSAPELAAAVGAITGGT